MNISYQRDIYINLQTKFKDYFDHFFLFSIKYILNRKSKMKCVLTELSIRQIDIFNYNSNLLDVDYIIQICPLDKKVCNMQAVVNDFS